MQANKNISVLHLSATKDWGGGENHILNLVTHKIQGSNAQHYILCVKNSEIYKRLSGENINLYPALMFHKLSLNYVFRIILLCKKNKINLIHIHDTTALTLAVMATKFANLPPFIFSKKTSYLIKERKGTLYKYNHPKIAKILCVSDKTLKNCKASIEDHSKLVRIYHGTNTKKLSVRHDINFRKKIGLSEHKILIGNIANHWRSKNLATFLECAHEIINVRGFKNFHFIQIGQFTQYTPALLKLQSELNLNKNVHFFNEIKGASGLIPQFDISLVTSQSEGLPQFIYESFYYKIAVVSTNVGGIPEVIKDGVNGMLSNPYEPQSLADKLIALSSNTILRDQFAELSYQKLIKDFTSKKMAEQTLSEYKNVLYGEN